MSTGSRTSTAAPATVPRRRNDGDLEGPRRQACLRHLPRGRLPRDGRVLMPPAVIRSLLFVPGHDERKIEKALAGAADAVLLDLEDAVAEESKARPREVTAAWLEQNGRPPWRDRGGRTG